MSRTIMSKQDQAKTAQDASSVGTHPDGHVLLGGARWHWPKKGSPTECGVEGCERALRVDRSPTPWLDDLPDAPAPEPVPSTASGDAA